MHHDQNVPKSSAVVASKYRSGTGRAHKQVADTPISDELANHSRKAPNSGGSLRCGDVKMLIICRK